jgi:predicted DNA-binding transcriptional regulator AlpA
MGKMSSNVILIPRVIRLRDAAAYLGMDKNRFDREVRPSLTEFPIGDQGVGFDRFDLDNWFDEYKARNGRPGKQKGVNKPWDERKSPVSSTAKAFGTSTKLSEEEEFARALVKVTSKRGRVFSARDRPDPAG